MAGKRNISYIKPAEPSFLVKFKRHVGYKEGPTVDTKKEAPSLGDLPERPDADDEQPVVVVLKDGDLTQDQAQDALNQMQRRETEEDEKAAGDGRIIFKKPLKRNSNESKELNTCTSSKKMKDDKQKNDKPKRKKSARKVKNASLLSFGEGEEEEEET